MIDNFFLSIVKRLDKALAKNDRGTVRQIEAVMCSDKRRDIDTTDHLMLLAIEHGLEHTAHHLFSRWSSFNVWRKASQYECIVAASLCSNRAMLPFIVKKILITDEAIFEAALVSAQDACEPRNLKSHIRNAHENAIGYVAFLNDESLFYQQIAQFPEEIRTELFESLPSRRALKNLPQAQAEIKQTSKRRL